MFVVDQVNNLYNLKEDERQPFINIWKGINSSTPLYMVSSKNNDYLANRHSDPVRACTGSDQSIQKINMDTKLSC